MRFNYLNVPDQWRHYWTKYPEGYTIIEALINWVSQVDSMVDNQNKLNETVETFGEELADFIERFDPRLQETVKDTLGEWKQSGFLDVLINEALQTQMDQLDEKVSAELANNRFELSQKLGVTEFEEWANSIANGRPTLFYSSLADLQLAHPNGAEGVALTNDTNPPTIYVWNGSSWQNFGEYTGTSLQDYQVNVRNLSSRVWDSIEAEHAKTSVINNLGDNKYYLSDHLVAEGHTTSFRTVFIDQNGYYYPSYTTDKFPSGAISVAMKVRAGSGFALQVDFRTGVGSGDVLGTYDLRDYGAGWYFLENIPIPEGAGSARIRIDYRKHLNPSTNQLIVDYITIEDGTRINRDIYAPATIVSRTENIEKELAKSSLEKLIPYTFPSGFRWKNNPIAGKLFTDGKGKFDVVGFNMRDYVPNGTTYYVDINNGSNSNSGLTPDEPLQTIEEAYNKPDSTIIRVAEGVYDRVEGLFNVSPVNKNLAIIAMVGHKVELHAGNPMTLWDIVDGYVGVYKSYRGGSLPYIIDATQSDARGAHKKLTQVTTIQEVSDTAGSYAHIGTDVFVHLHDNRRPDNKTVWVMSNVPTINVSGGNTIYLEGIDVYGGASALYVANTTSGLRPRVFGKNSNFYYSEDINSDVVQLQGVALSIFENCKAGFGLKDGFNYHWRNNIAPLSIEINCEGFENGNPEDANDQGSTTHDGGSIIRVNGAYYRNDGANIAEDATVGDAPTQSLNLGCVGFESVTTFDKRNVNFHAYVGVDMWLDGCVGYGSDYNIHNSDTDQTNLYTRNNHFTGVLAPEGVTPVEY